MRHTLDDFLLGHRSSLGHMQKFVGVVVHGGMRKHPHPGKGLHLAQELAIALLFVIGEYKPPVYDS